MVTGEFPPTRGGVGRYTDSLTRHLRGRAELIVACERSIQTTQENVYGIIKKGDYRNSDHILNLAKEKDVDFVHVQYLRELYDIDPYTVYDIAKSGLRGSTLDKLYLSSTVPIVSTMHTFPPPREEYANWVREVVSSEEGRFSFLPSSVRTTLLARLEERFILRPISTPSNSVQTSNEIVNLARVSFDVIKRGKIIYHGAEPAYAGIPNKIELRQELGLPDDKRLLLAFGYAAEYKGFNVLDNLNLPKEWALVTKQTVHDRTKAQTVKIPNAISLGPEYMNDETVSKLFFACDAMIFPYKNISISGVLFDCLAHGLPFIGSDLAFFREFADAGLGIVSKRDPISLVNALHRLSSDYDQFKRKVEEFNPQLRWENVASLHSRLYNQLRD